MTDKFEQLLEFVVNDEMDKANELFHEIVVEQSRSIYENLIADEEEMEEASEDDGESVDETEEDDGESVEENMDLEDSYSMEADDEETMGGDATDDLGGDVGMGDMGDEEGPEGSEDQAIFDIKNAIEELEAAFAELEQAKGMGGDDMGGMDDMDDIGGDDMGADDEDESMMMAMRENRRMTREYVEKVGNDWEKNSQKTDGDYAGAGTGETQSKPVSGKSPISSGKGKPTTGATAGNIARGDSGEGNNTGTSPTGKTGGFVKNAQDMKTGNGNVPGGKMGVKNLSKVGSGYPGNNKTPGPVGSGTGDKAGQTSVGQAKSPINGAPNRNA